MGVQLPRWVWVGAGALACVLGFLGSEHQAVTHLTGTTTLLGAAIVTEDARAMLHLAGLVFAFVLGAVLSGVVVQDATLRLGRRYGVALTRPSWTVRQLLRLDDVRLAGYYEMAWDAHHDVVCLQRSPIDA